MDGSLCFILGIILFCLLNLFIFRVGFSSKVDPAVSIMTRLSDRKSTRQHYRHESESRMASSA